MRVIHKFKVGTGGTIAPRGKVVLVDYQGDNTELPTIWIEYDPSWPTCEYAFIGTGHTVPHGAEHVGSAICGRLVWHVYRGPVR